MKINLTKLNKKSLLIKSIALILIIGGGLFGYDKFFKPKTTQKQYQTAQVEKGNLVATVSASGQVSTANNTPVVTQVTGIITKLYVQNGDSVKTGDIIATLELDQSSQQKYIQQLANYQNAKNSLESAKITKESLKSTFISTGHSFEKAMNKGIDHDNPEYTQLNADYTVAKERYENQDAVIAQAQTSLNNAGLSLQNLSPTISAPISGIITGLSLQEGSVIPAQAISSSTQTLSQNIANITTSNFPIVTINLTEIDIPKVKIGNKAILTFDAFPDTTYTGKVFSINTTGSVSSGVTTYPTTIILDVEAPNIYANMSATANIIIDTKDDVLFVPNSAIQTQNGQSTVRVIENGEIQYISVETGIASDSSIEIVSGLEEGDEVVTTVITQNTTKTTTGSSSPFGIRTGGMGGGAH